MNAYCSEVTAIVVESSSRTFKTELGEDFQSAEAKHQGYIEVFTINTECILR